MSALDSPPLSSPNSYFEANNSSDVASLANFQAAGGTNSSYSSSASTVRSTSEPNETESASVQASSAGQASIPIPGAGQGVVFKHEQPVHVASAPPALSTVGPSTAQAQQNNAAAGISVDTESKSGHLAALNTSDSPRQQQGAGIAITKSTVLTSSPSLVSTLSSSLNQTRAAPSPLSLVTAGSPLSASSSANGSSAAADTSPTVSIEERLERLRRLEDEHKALRDRLDVIVAQKDEARQRLMEVMAATVSVTTPPNVAFTLDEKIASMAASPRKPVPRRNTQKAEDGSLGDFKTGSPVATTGSGSPTSLLSVGSTVSSTAPAPALNPFEGMSETDEATLLNHMKDPSNGVPIMDRRWRLRMYPACFVGQIIGVPRSLDRSPR